MDIRESLARHFGALKNAISLSEECYEAPTNTASLENLDPQFRSLETGTPVNIKYLHQLDEKELLFVVYEKCAEMGTAPRLRGFEDIGAGRKMVIMDALDKEYKPFDKRTLSAGAEKHFKERLIELHQANFVHGDVRDD